MINHINNKESKKSILYLLIFFILFVFVFPFFYYCSSWGRGDWDYFLNSNYLPYKTILEYAQFPLWNPWGGGGRELHGNPQTGFLRPTYGILLLFGPLKGMKIELVFMICLGFWGVLRLAQTLGIGEEGQIWMILIFCCSSYFALHFAEGHVHFSGFYFFPWIFDYYLKSLDSPIPYMFGGAFFLVWIIFMGGMGHVLLPICLFLTLYSVFLCLQKKSRNPLLRIILMFFLAALWSAVKWLPVLDTLSRFPRLTKESSYLTLAGFYYSYLWRGQNWRPLFSFSGQVYGFHEYGAYLGILALAMILYATWKFFSKDYPLILTGWLCFLLALGNFHLLSPWNLLHSLPVFRSTRVPYRYSILFIFMAAIICGRAIHLLSRQKRYARYVWILTFLLALDILTVSVPILWKAFPRPLQAKEVSSPFCQIWDKNPYRSGCYSSMYLNSLKNQGTLNDYDPLPNTCHAIPKGRWDYQGEVFSLPTPSKGKVKYLYWSPNRLLVQVPKGFQGLVIVNQNTRKGWQVIGGKKTSWKGLLAARIQKETSGQIEFIYSPLAFWWGLWISLISILGTGILLWQQKKKSPSL